MRRSLTRAFEVFQVAASHPQLSYLVSGFSARGHLYLVDMYGFLARLDPATFEPNDWVVDLKLPPHYISKLSGSFTDGRYGYILSGYGGGKDAVARVHLPTSEVETATFILSIPGSVWAGFHDGKSAYILQVRSGPWSGTEAPLMKTLVQMSLGPSRKCVQIPKQVAIMYEASFCPEP